MLELESKLGRRRIAFFFLVHFLLEGIEEKGKEGGERFSWPISRGFLELERQGSC